MFGFPTRADFCSMVTEVRPKVAPGKRCGPGPGHRHQPVAPGAETVKDGVVYTAAGVVHYRRVGPRLREVPDPLGPAVPIGTCRHCQAVDLSPGPDTNACGVCGTGAPDFQVVQLAQPRGFRTLYDGGRDFDGVFEWTPRPRVQRPTRSRSL